LDAKSARVEVKTDAEDERVVKGGRGGKEEKEKKMVKDEKHEVADKEEEKLVKKDFGALLAHYYERKKFWASEVDGLAVWWLGGLVGWWVGGLVGWWGHGVVGGVC
jgi:hypothetical protein